MTVTVEVKTGIVEVTTGAAIIEYVGQLGPIDALSKSANLADLTDVAAARSNLGLATVATSGSYADLSDKPVAYSLPIATGAVLGGVKASSTVSVDAGGVMTATDARLPGLSLVDSVPQFTDTNGTIGVSPISIDDGGVRVSGNTLLRYDPPITDVLAPGFYVTAQNAQFTNGPVNNPNYWDHITHFWWNGKNGDRVDTSQMGWGMSIESKFTNNGTLFGGEWHLQGIDTSGTSHRWAALYAADGAVGSAFTFSVDTFTLRNDAGSARITTAFNGSSASVNLSNNTAFYADYNNSAVVYQKNSSGHFVSLPFLDAQNRVVFNGGVYSDAPTADTEYGAANIFYVTSLASGKSLLYGQHGNVAAGNVYALNLYNCTSTAKVIGAIGNNSTGSTVLESRTASGDPIFSLNIDGVRAYSIGIKAADNKLHIGKGTQSVSSTSNDLLVIDAASGNSGFGNADAVCRVDAVGPTRSRGYATLALLNAVYPASLGDDMRCSIGDATLSLTAGLGTVAVGGGSNWVPVISRSGNWVIG